ncbi:grpIintron_endo, group I intron endonuclease [uncultured Caudovirales phage]|uniref:GrpIintron_endo, group I intron endonuclease n=1 Tax=uncultured Caudovirales phage TaxID=2100421 RepID=A0A6J5SJ70_9CAUD|nr:grpIintron_endo, group I intron endonuclease [uncultured Caudovirales phage]CAB4214181.1 grpIintron_endo, group I intron endonuclease [uncultured Caudovirales phage]CAB5229410.1 grpIintron_endo, group I intron endonuclease [uncultured Caudovirales phage]
MNINTSVYWIHHPKHTNMFSQGYIGVSNNTKVRWNDHSKRPSNLHIERAIKKYGWDNLIKEVVLVANRDYCLDIETKLRPSNQIGWNVVLGGGNPPSSLGKKFIKSEETKAKLSAAKMGHRHTPEIEALILPNLLVKGIPTRFIKGQVPYNKGIACSEEKKEAIRKANTGRIQPQEERDKRANSLLGHIVTQETRDKIRIKNMGRKSPMLGKHFSKVICPHCNTEGGLSGMKSWHFDNCRNKGELS